MAWGTVPTIVLNSQLRGGPKVISGTVTIANGDTSGAVDFASYFNVGIDAIIGLVIFNTTAAVAYSAIDITSTATTMTVTHSDPADASGAICYFTAVGR